MLNDQHVLTLARQPGPWATICMPLSGGGPLAKQDPIRYRNLVRAIADQLDARATEPARQEKILASLREIEGSRDAFDRRAGGLVVFANEESVEHWHLPVAVEEAAAVDERPFLEPLIPIVTDTMHFYVVVMSQHDVRLIECSRYVARELPLPEGTPKRVEEAAGWDVEEPHLQAHGRLGQGQFHTQAGGKDDREADLTKFVRDVDAGLWTAIPHKKAPVVLMTSEKLDQVVRRMSRLHIDSPTIFGGFDRTTIDEIHERARELMTPRFEQKVEEAKERFCDLERSGSATSQVEQVVIAAADGRVDTLFVREGAHLEGAFDVESHSVRLGNGHADTTDLIDRATTDAFLSGGTIYRLPRDRMPVEADAAAILRY
jgi:hypothetical protein